jgi:hypothetical protein
MADTLKTYSLICPDADCAEEFDVSLAPEALTEGGVCIQCPACGDEWEWEYDPDTGTLQLQLPGDEDDLDTDLLEDEDGEDDDEDLDTELLEDAETEEVNRRGRRW